MQTTKHHSGTESDISQQESELKAKGYRQVNKTSDKELGSFEYIKRSYSGNAESFEGTTKYQLTWLE